MQTIWKGAVSFGLVSIPVRVFAATGERDISFHQVHVSDGGRIRYRRVCEKDGDEVPYSDIARGYPLPDGGLVILTDEDFASLPLPTSKTIEVLKFVPMDQVDSIYLGRSYYLQADGTGAKPYVLLRDALERSGKVALVKVALRRRESMAVLRPRDSVLLLQTMLWPDEVRAAEGLSPAEDVTVRAQEIAMAESYIDTLAGDFEPDEYSDEYREALEKLVAAKTAGAEVAAPEEEAPDTGKVVDLMAALQASVEAAKKSRGGQERPRKTAKKASGKAAAGAGDGKSPAKKPEKKTAKKSPAKKAAGQRTTRKAAGGSG